MGEKRARTKYSTTCLGCIRPFQHLAPAEITHLLKVPTDIQYTQRFWGHNNLNTTLRYPHVMMSKMRTIGSTLNKLLWKGGLYFACFWECNWPVNWGLRDNKNASVKRSYYWKKQRLWPQKTIWRGHVTIVERQSFINKMGNRQKWSRPLSFPSWSSAPDHFNFLTETDWQIIQIPKRNSKNNFYESKLSVLPLPVIDPFHMKKRRSISLNGRPT